MILYQILKFDDSFSTRVEGQSFNTCHITFHGKEKKGMGEFVGCRFDKCQIIIPIIVYSDTDVNELQNTMILFVKNNTFNECDFTILIVPEDEEKAKQTNFLKNEISRLFEFKLFNDTHECDNTFSIH